MTELARLYEIIQRPHVTEKGTDDGARRNAYHFRVPVAARKPEIKLAVEKLFGVTVRDVNTLRVKPKARRRGWVSGSTQAWKKAMVTLTEGQTIELV